MNKYTCPMHQNPIESVNRGDIWRELKGSFSESADTVVQNVMDTPERKLRAAARRVTIEDIEPYDNGGAEYDPRQWGTEPAPSMILMTMQDTWRNRTRFHVQDTAIKMRGKPPRVNPLKVRDLQPYRLHHGEYEGEFYHSLARSVGTIAIICESDRTDMALRSAAEKHQAALLHHTYHGATTKDWQNALGYATRQGLGITGQAMSLLCMEKQEGYTADELVHAVTDKGLIEDLARGIGSGTVSTLATVSRYLPGAVRVKDGKVALSPEATAYMKATKQSSQKQVRDLRDRNADPERYVGGGFDFIGHQGEGMGMTCPARGSIQKIAELILHVRGVLAS